MDDEPIARQAIVRLLRDDSDVERLDECGDGARAVQLVRSRSPDLVFLDIQMPAMSGLDVVSAIGAERMPATVFVTAFEQYAVRAFETHAVDCLVKPFGHERFADALARAKMRLAAGDPGNAVSARIMQALESLRRRDDYIERAGCGRSIPGSTATTWSPWIPTETAHEPLPARGVPAAGQRRGKGVTQGRD